MTLTSSYHRILRSRCTSVLTLAVLAACAMGDAPDLDSRGPNADLPESDTTGEPPSGGTAGEDDGALALAVQALFTAKCSECHGPGSTGEAGMDYITDLTALVINAKIIPGDPESSPIYRRITSSDASMPPPSAKDPLSDLEIDLVRRWILAGAPATARPPSCEDNPFISLDAMVAAMNADIAITSSSDRPFVRYLTLTHLYNSGVCDEDLEPYRDSVAKALNSLSREPFISRPEEVGADGLILRVDLRDYGWQANPILEGQGFADAWEATVAANPLAIEYIGDFATELKTNTTTSVPFQPADGFLQVVTRGQLYYDLLKLPATAALLESELGVSDPLGDFVVGEIVRAAFRKSGVSAWNRVIERRRIAFSGSRAYWRSYDFRGEAITSNVIAHPLDFQEAGGEIIFNLENGAQAYMLVDGVGARLEAAPNDIVQDLKQRDSVVKNGISCIACHDAGIKLKQDELLPFYLENKVLYPLEDHGRLEDLYRPHEEMDSLQGMDATAFQAAMTAAGVVYGVDEPILAASLAFEADLDLRRAAAELGVTQAQLEQRLVLLDTSLQVLRVGTISRDTFTAQYLQAICALLPGDEVFPACPGSL